MLVGRWDDNQEIAIIQKIENLDAVSMLERGEIMNHIICEYMRLKSIKFHLRSFNDVCNTLQNIIEEAEFREFTLNRYHVFIYLVKKAESICICKVSNEILSIIHNRGSITDDELLDKVKQIIRKSRFIERKLAGYLNRDKRIMDKA